VLRLSKKCGRDKVFLAISTREKLNAREVLDSYNQNVTANLHPISVELFLGSNTT
jgi:hypothetical protein